ncbi:MAG: T9SS type A sorting domain-containing protein [Algibacter sp.]|uniref:T9SS type A sorting domain-containing protein n=1 Tax=Algibacter sp. TaxID=1872428 RepID=UPI002632C763|nr:T9SS type A sorting domain-containing protein [Algibacter sp.]MDG1731248.1 T9SS type A sorting domain-containing protein [Algibacter sp.]MDG2178811.1 T9SS type A sorting domain-containing protein [Algibacter sp.]
MKIKNILRKNPDSRCFIDLRIFRTTLTILFFYFFSFFGYSQTTYYLDATNGSDDSSGTSINLAWQSLTKISMQVLQPGDEVLFKKGERFDGHFVVNGSGTQTQPILISSYGTGNKPIITGEVGAAEGGDYQEAIYVNNNEHIIFDDLEINNERLVTRNGIDDKDAFGIYIHNTGPDVLRNFTFRNLTLQNVYAVQPMLDPEDFNGLEVAGIRFFSTWNTANNHKNIQDVLVEDCYFTDLQRLGVHVKHDGGNGDDDESRNKNFVFRNNTFYKIGGTCILPTRTYNCLIENNIFDYPGDNSDPRMPARGSSVWTWRSINTVIQYNQCLHIRGYLDSHGIHVDHENVNTFIQYNYMEDCEGGFVEILGGNVNAVYRFNVSVNDGWRENPGWTNSNHTIWINEKTPGDQVHYSDESYIYNNTVVMNYNYSTAIDIDATNTHIYNNIFYAINGASLGGKQMVIRNNGTPLFMTNNLFFGSVRGSFRNSDSSPVDGEPFFNNENSGDKFGYQLNTNSNAINTGVAHQGPPVAEAGIGIFVNVPEYPNVDFYGHPIDLSSGTPNIGACNAKNGELLSTDNVKLADNFKIYPNPTNKFISLTAKSINKHSKLIIYNTLGQIVMKPLFKEFIDVSNLENGVYFLKINDIQTNRFIVNK